MKSLVIATIAACALASVSCQTAETVGEDAVGTVKTVGRVAGDAAQGTVNAGRNVSGAVGRDVEAGGRALNGR